MNRSIWQVRPSAGLDQVRPGAVKHVAPFEKGDRLLDGRIATGNEKIFSVQLPPSGDGQAKRLIIDEPQSPS